MENRQFKRVLITGIKGSGASYLAEEIFFNHPEVEYIYGLARWHSTDSTNNNLNRIQSSKFKVYECDLNDAHRVSDVIAEIKPDVVFHVASHSNVNTSFLYPAAVIQNNVMGTVNLLEALRRLENKPVFVLASTSEVYGITTRVPIDESSPLQPSNPYAVSKLAQDALSYAYYLSYGLPVIRTRAFTYLNPRRHDIFATSFARQVVEIELGLRKVLRHGNLESTRTMIDVRDNMRAYWFAATRGKLGEVYNIGGKTVIRVGEFLDMLKENAKCEIPTEVDPKLLRPVDIVLQIPDTSKFERDTGWSVQYSFEDSIRFFIKEIRKDVCRENGIDFESYYG